MIEWPEEQADELVQRATFVRQNVRDLEVLGTLRWISKLTDTTTEIAGAVIEIAGAETTLTQKALAEALGIPVSMLRGLRAR